jgi:hypothetical protein
MISLHPQFVIDENKQYRAVLLSMEEWEKVLNALEELDDCCAYDEAKTGSPDAVPFKQVARVYRKGKS